MWSPAYLQINDKQPTIIQNLRPSNQNQEQMSQTTCGVKLTKWLLEWKECLKLHTVQCRDLWRWWCVGVHQLLGVRGGQVMARGGGAGGRSRTLITLVFLASAWNMFNMTRKICLRFKTENYWKSQSTIFPWFGHKTSQSMKIYARNVKLSGAVKSGVNFHIIFILCLDWFVRKGFLFE